MLEVKMAPARAEPEPDRERDAITGGKESGPAPRSRFIRAFRSAIPSLNGPGSWLIIGLLLAASLPAWHRADGAILSARGESARVSVLDYGAVPGDGKDDLAAFRRMLNELRDRRYLTIVFPPGEYDLRDEMAVALMDSVMRGELGNNPEPEMFRPYRPYVRGLDFSRFADLTVEAAGAELICDGWMEPVSLDQCERVTLRGADD